MDDSGPLRLAYLVSEDTHFCLHSLDVARAARDAGYRVIVMAREGGARPRIEREGFLFQPVRLFRGNLNPAVELLTLADVVGAYRRHRPHLVHQIAFKPILYGGWAARLAGVRATLNVVTGLGYAFTEGAFTEEEGRRRWLRRVAEAGYRTVLHRPSALTLFENPDDRALFIERGLAPAAATGLTSGSGVDPARFAPRPEPAEPITVLLAARMLRDKGVGELIEAGRLLRAKGLSLRIVLAGRPDPPNPATLSEGQLAAWHAAGDAEWVGYQEDVPGLIAHCHIACLPSYREGLPVFLIEAASCGRPIVTTDVPGCREVVREGENGLLVPPRDPQALAAALARLIRDQGLREEMGRRGRERVLREFSIARVVEKTLGLYRALLAGRPAS